MDAPLELIANFHELYDKEIRPAVDGRNYQLAWLLIVDPATTMRKHWPELTSRVDYVLVLALAAYGLSQKLEKYIGNPSNKLEAQILTGRDFLEKAIAQSKLPKFS